MSEQEDQFRDDLFEEIGDAEQILTDDVIDDDAHADPRQEDIGTFDPGEDEDDDNERAIEPIDDLPDVGVQDPDEEPELDELDEEDETDG